MCPLRAAAAWQRPGLAWPSGAERSAGRDRGQPRRRGRAEPSRARARARPQRDQVLLGLALTPLEEARAQDAGAGSTDEALNEVRCAGLAQPNPSLPVGTPRASPLGAPAPPPLHYTLPPFGHPGDLSFGIRSMARRGVARATGGCPNKRRMACVGGVISLGEGGK